MARTTPISTRAGIPPPSSSFSFWHSEPSTFLIDHRTTEALPSYADIVIVGSGLTGSAAARFLAEDSRADGLSVLMLEARQACWCATGRNGGHCQALLFDRAPDVAAFEVANYQKVKEYIEEHEVDCEWRMLKGCRTFWTEELMKVATKEVEALKKEAPELGKLVKIVTDPKELLTKHRVKGAVGATVSDGAASLWPYKYVSHILERLINMGKLNLQTKTPVTSINSISNSARGNAEDDDGRARHILHTPRGIVLARHIIFATNAYISALLPQFTDIIVPVRGEMSALLPPHGATLLPNSYGFLGMGPGANPNHDDYLVQRPFSGVPNPAGHLMFGGGRGAANLEPIGTVDDSIIDEGMAAYLRKSLPPALDFGAEAPPEKELTASHQWTGIMGYSRDNHPWVGAMPEQAGLWVAAGYTGHGMPNGTLCGKAAVEMLLAEEKGKDVKDVTDKMVEEGKLPRSYVLSKERMQKAAELPTVAAQEHMVSFRGTQLIEIESIDGDEKGKAKL